MLSNVVVCLRVGITNSSLGRSESGQAEAVVEDTFGKKYHYTVRD